MDKSQDNQPEPTPKPSQAEGARDDTSDATSGSSTIADAASQGKEPQATSKPSQAEGDRDTINADLKQKEASGDL